MMLPQNLPLPFSATRGSQHPGNCSWVSEETRLHPWSWNSEAVSARLGKKLKENVQETRLDSRKAQTSEPWSSFRISESGWTRVHFRALCRKELPDHPKPYLNPKCLKYQSPKTAFSLQTFRSSTPSGPVGTKWTEQPRKWNGIFGTWSWVCCKLRTEIFGLREVGCRLVCFRVLPILQTWPWPRLQTQAGFQALCKYQSSKGSVFKKGPIYNRISGCIFYKESFQNSTFWKN